MIRFFNLLGGGIDPQKADKAAMGTLPTNGFRYCEPVRTASGFGWYVFLPMELMITWDGSEYHFSVDGAENWYLLTDAIQYPDFSAAFDEHAPEGIRGCAPPFVSRTNDADILQIWTGSLARTDPGIGVYVKGPTNLNQGLGYSVLEGVIQTEWWFGPTFANVRIHQRDKPVIFRASKPFIQLQPFSLALFEEFDASKPEVASGLDALSGDDWKRYEDTVVRRMKTRQRFGDYAVEARQKRQRKKGE